MKFYESSSNKSSSSLFIAVRQNTCSSQVECFNFFDKTHSAIEQKIILNTIGSKKQKFLVDNLLTFDESKKKYIALLAEEVISIQEISLQDIAALMQKGPLYLFLSDPNQIQTILQNFSDLNVFVLRHEGDFNIQGKEVNCDCNGCLLSVFANNNDYKFIGLAGIDYYAGNQYVLLQYGHSTKQTRNNSPDISGCKQRPKVLNKYTVNKNSMSNSENLHLKNKAYESYHAMGSPKYFCAPMIGQSELAFRMMLREHASVDICSTPMAISDLFVENEEYRDEIFSTCLNDRPLVVQFSADKPKILLQAARKVQSFCDAVDINLGCPQPTGRRNHYGAWLMEEWTLVHELINYMHENLTVPVWCKIRIFEDVNLTIEYAKMIESGGCSLLTVHGRLRKCHMNDMPADWTQIKAVKEALNIPVIANGSIVSLASANECLAFTGCDGVMAASKLLIDPFLFSTITPSPREVALLYLQYAKKYQALMRYLKPHVMQIVGNYLHDDTKMQIKLCQSVDELEQIIEMAVIEESIKEGSSSTFNTLFDYT